MLNTLERATQITVEEELLAFFAEKFELSDVDSDFNVQSVMLAIFDWWFVPRSKHLKEKMLSKTARAAYVYARSRMLPEYMLEASRYARSEKCHTIEALQCAYSSSSAELPRTITPFLGFEHASVDTTAT